MFSMVVMPPAMAARERPKVIQPDGFMPAPSRSVGGADQVHVSVDAARDESRPGREFVMDVFVPPTWLYGHRDTDVAISRGPEVTRSRRGRQLKKRNLHQGHRGTSFMIGTFAHERRGPARGALSWAAPAGA